MFYFKMQLPGGHMATPAPPAQQLLQSLLQRRGVWPLCLPPDPRFASQPLNPTDTEKRKAATYRILLQAILTLEPSQHHHLVSASPSSKAGNIKTKLSGRGTAKFGHKFKWPLLILDPLWFC